MSKERLEELLELHEKAVVAYEDCDFLEMRGYLETLFLEGFTDYLIEQAERVQELEEDSKDAKFAIDMLQAENQRYKQALEDIRRILDLYHHIDYSKSVTRRRLFDLANEALEGELNE